MSRSRRNLSHRHRSHLAQQYEMTWYRHRHSLSQPKPQKRLCLLAVANSRQPLLGRVVFLNSERGDRSHVGVFYCTDISPTL